MARTKRQDEVVPGDVIIFLGTPHLIDRVEPYEHPTIPAVRGIARASDGWGMTLCSGPASWVEVA